MIRIAILAGVSSDPQVETQSIPDQIATCRKTIAQLGGTEVACWVMDGYSRTGYDSLADAMSDIPPLGEAIEAAGRDEYDVLMLDNFDRLGDLGQLVGVRFKRYKKQLYSARQSGRLHEPGAYDPYDDESADISMHVEGIIQRYRLNKLRRGYKLGTRARAEKGLYPLRFPVGYITTDKDEPLQQNPLYVPLLISFKDKLLEGYSIRQLEQYARTTGIFAPNGKPWTGGSIYKILVNPFYAGVIKFGKDIFSGQHEGLWTWEEYQRIRETLKRRHEHNPRTHVKPFSGLMFCSECGHLLWHREGVWRCHPPGHDHIAMTVQEANYTIGRRLAEALRDYEEGPITTSTPDIAGAVEILDKQIERVRKGYDGGIYTLTQAQERIGAIKAQIAHLEAEGEERQKVAAQRERLAQSRDKLLPLLDHLPTMFARHDPGASNRMLREILRKIIVHPDRQIEFVW